MGYLELAVLSLSTLGILGFAFALAWIDASPRKRGNSNLGKSRD